MLCVCGNCKTQLGDFFPLGDHGGVVVKCPWCGRENEARNGPLLEAEKAGSDEPVELHVRAERPAGGQAGGGSYPPGAHVEFEYDLTYSGGDYEDVGEVAYVPGELVARLGSEAAFRAHTGHDPIHIVSYRPDELFTADGEAFEEDGEDEPH